jgi:hypothetical protein
MQLAIPIVRLVMFINEKPLCLLKFLKATLIKFFIMANLQVKVPAILKNLVLLQAPTKSSDLLLFCSVALTINSTIRLLTM